MSRNSRTTRKPPEPKTASRKRRRFRAPPNEASWIETDAYDRDCFAALVDASHSLKEVIEAGRSLVPHFDALVQDLFALCFKSNVVVRRTDDVRPSAHPIGPLVRDLTSSPAVAALREQSELDEAQAGLGAVLLAEEVVELIRNRRFWTRSDLQELWSLAAEEEELRQKIETYETANELADDAEELEGGDEEAADASDGSALSGEARARLRRAAEQLEHDADVGQATLLQKARRIASVPPPAPSLRRLGARAATVAQALGERSEDSPGWDSGISTGERSSAAARLELGKRLVTNPKIKRLATMVGRMRESALRLRKTTFERANEETHTISVGRELGRLLPQELIRSRNPVLRRDFLRRLIEGRVEQYDLRGPDERGRGPMVVCLDGSHSMAGEKELWAKAVTLTLLDIARRQRRLFRCLCFSSADQPLWTVDFNPRRRYEVEERKIYDLAEYFPGGGTDFATPLDAAVECLAATPYKRGDIVFITDGECRVEPEWLEGFRAERKRLGFTVFSVLIDVGPSTTKTVREFSDRVTGVRQLTDEAARDLFVSV